MNRTLDIARRVLKRYMIAATVPAGLSRPHRLICNPVLWRSVLELELDPDRAVQRHD